MKSEDTREEITDTADVSEINHLGHLPSCLKSLAADSQHFWGFANDKLSLIASFCVFLARVFAW